MMEKDRISAKGLNPEVVEEFKNIVKNKYGKLHTVYGLELEKALEMYISANRRSQGSTHTHERRGIDTKAPNEEKSRPKSLKSFEMVKNTFLTNTNDTDDFQRGYAERLIKETMRVYDTRTIDKYASELKEAWMLK